MKSTFHFIAKEAPPELSYPLLAELAVPGAAGCGSIVLFHAPSSGIVVHIADNKWHPLGHYQNCWVDPSKAPNVWRILRSDESVELANSNK